jgi:hypothetical protein
MPMVFAKPTNEKKSQRSITADMSDFIEKRD